MTTWDAGIRELARRCANSLMGEATDSQVARVATELQALVPLLDAAQDAYGCLCAWQHVKAERSDMLEMAQPTIENIKKQLDPWHKP